jgi:hypothetical protein
VFKVEGAKLATVGHVSTPYVETQKWLEASSKSFDVIELETAYLHEAFKGRVNYQSFFLISDVVGSEHESLASADSNGRKRSLLHLIKTIATQEGVTHVIPPTTAKGQSFEKAGALQKRIDALAPKRSIESRVQLAQAAWHADLNSEDQLKALIAKEKPFSRDILNRTLTSAGHVISLLSEGLAEQNKSARLYLPPEFMETRWNPSAGLDILLQVDSNDDLKWAEDTMARLMSENPQLKKAVRVRLTSQEPDWKWLSGIMGATDSSHCLTDLYATLLLRQVGVISTVNTSGQMRYERVSELKTELLTKNIDRAVRAPLCRDAFTIAK